MKQLALLAICSSALTCVAANADTITQSDPVLIDTTAGGSSESLNFDQFNSALGTLTGVSFELTGTADAVYSVATNSTSAFTTTGTTSTTLQVSGTGFTPASSPTLTAGVTDGAVNASPSSGTFTETYFPGSASAVDLSGSVDSGSLAAFIGAGTVAFAAEFPSATSSGSFTNPAGTFAGAGGGGQASGSLEVTYDYTPVPLPASAWLALSGLIGLGALARKQRAA